MEKYWGLPDLGIASLRVAINLHVTTTICYNMHTAVRNGSISKPLSLLQSFSLRITLKQKFGLIKRVDKVELPPWKI